MRELSKDEWEIIRKALESIIPIYEEDARMHRGTGQQGFERVAAQFDDQARKARAVLAKIGESC